MAGTVFWDVDTQVDFMEPQGALFVDGAPTIVPQFERLTRYARARGIPIVASVDDHVMEDDEISQSPDFRSTYPPHCLRATPGREKIAATRPVNPLVIENRPLSLATLRAWVEAHRGEIVLEKNRFDVFTQPNTNLLLEIVAPRRVVVYGVALDVCNAYAVEGFLSRGDIEVTLVEDAVRAIRPDRGRELIARWRERGVEIVSTASIVES